MLCKKMNIFQYKYLNIFKLRYIYLRCSQNLHSFYNNNVNSSRQIAQTVQSILALKYFNFFLEAYMNI